ncbi:uncharacterized protein LOC143145008 [Ptiloglossa arizonensis]|uniref:uncharacterized protein LOC143145008 n=1 Tax=Ptiloglossa arizonensis TaxID=3350558 RepID=UPI003FA183E3
MNNIVLFTLFMTMCLYLEAQGVCKLGNGQEIDVGTHHINCVTYMCNPDGHVTGLGCPVYQCQKGKQIGYRDTNVNLAYPECCGGPICAD